MAHGNYYNASGAVRMRIGEATYTGRRQHPDGAVRASNVATAYTAAAGFRGPNAPDGGMRVTLNDTTYKGYFAPDGSVRVTTTGRDDGSLKIESI